MNGRRFGDIDSVLWNGTAGLRDTAHGALLGMTRYPRERGLGLAKSQIKHAPKSRHTPGYRRGGSRGATAEGLTGPSGPDEVEAIAPCAVGGLRPKSGHDHFTHTPRRRRSGRCQLSSTGAIGAVVPIANDDNARLVFQAV